MKESAQTSIHISVHEQTLTVRRGAKELRTFPVSTSKFGLGTEEGSLKTPLGRFRVAEKIGAGAQTGTIFKSRKPVAVPTKVLADDDLIMSRILWLDGLDLENANTRERYIYIHGTNHEDKIGRSASHGCVRMKNDDVVELFDLVAVGTPVWIGAGVARKRRKKNGEKIVARTDIRA